MVRREIERRKKRREKEEKRRKEARFGVATSSSSCFKKTHTKVRGLILHLILLGFDRYILDLGVKLIVDL